MIDVVNVFIESLQTLLNQLVTWLPKLIIALLIWWIGQYFLTLASKWIKKIDIPGAKIDNKLINKFTGILESFGRFLLLLIVLDYLGVGRTIIAALAGGLTLSIAIALGIAFGQALVPDAKKLTSEVKKYLEK